MGSGTSSMASSTSSADGYDSAVMGSPTRNRTASNTNRGLSSAWKTMRGNELDGTQNANFLEAHAALEQFERDAMAELQLELAGVVAVV